SGAGAGGRPRARPPPPPGSWPPGPAPSRRTWSEGSRCRPRPRPRSPPPARGPPAVPRGRSAPGQPVQNSRRDLGLGLHKGPVPVLSEVLLEPGSPLLLVPEASEDLPAFPGGLLHGGEAV